MSFDGHAIVVSKVEEEGIEFGGAKADLLHVVIENLQWPASQELEGVKVTLDQGRQLHGGSEFHIQHAGEAEHHDEDVDRKDVARRVGETTGISPIGLSLLAGRGFKAHGELAQTLALGFEGLQEAAQSDHRSGVSHGPNLG